jgi:hypothetical protein
MRRERKLLVKTTKMMLRVSPKMSSGRLPLDAAATARMLSTDMVTSATRMIHMAFHKLEAWGRPERPRPRRSGASRDPQDQQASTNWT